MSGRGRKGRVSNELVAASCAAILAVYAAGYWRTRDEARRFEDQTQSRRPVRSAPSVPRLPAPVQPAEPQQNQVPETRPTPGPVLQPEPARSMPAVRAAEPTADPQPIAQSETQDPGITPAGAVVADPEPAPPAGVVWRDGVYTGWGRSFHGDIEARVVIRDGRIRSSEIATCATRYPCYVIETIFNQPVDRQSADVDRVSRATESADAYSDAVWQALQNAEQAPVPPAGNAAPSP